MTLRSVVKASNGEGFGLFSVTWRGQQIDRPLVDVASTAKIGAISANFDHGAPARPTWEAHGKRWRRNRIGRV
jgi:hypothetical protein